MTRTAEAPTIWPLLSLWMPGRGILGAAQKFESSGSGQAISGSHLILTSPLQKSYPISCPLSASTPFTYLFYSQHSLRKAVPPKLSSA